MQARTAKDAAAQRISAKVNESKFFEVDLHCLHVPEALEILRKHILLSFVKLMKGTVAGKQ